MSEANVTIDRLVMFEYLRGHRIEKLNGEYVYCDTKESTVDNYKVRPCGYCNLDNTEGGHDGCLGKLPGVMNACCGHGRTQSAYVQYWDGSTIHGEPAIKEIERLKI